MEKMKKDKKWEEKWADRIGLFFIVFFGACIIFALLHAAFFMPVGWDSGTTWTRMMGF